jgi:hypothetical protein
VSRRHKTDLVPIAPERPRRVRWVPPKLLDGRADTSDAALRRTIAEGIKPPAPEQTFDSDAGLSGPRFK